MSEASVHHGTLVVERTIHVCVARAYAAFADARERIRWAAPSESAVFIYDETDFRVGGRDLARCGSRDAPRFRVEACYVDIVPGHRVMFAESIREDVTLLATNITTIEFVPDGQATRVKVTVQVASLVGAAMIENTKDGHTGSLANMAAYLESRA